MLRASIASIGLFVALAPGVAGATSSSEIYTSAAYGYGRFEARVRFAAGDGVVSSFFLWKDGSEKAGVFWNELDYEKIGADCHLTDNAYYGNPGATHSQTPTLSSDLCGAWHTYAYEWTPDAIVWSVDGTEIRRETGAAAQAYADNAATPGMQIHFNTWPGDASFGGNFNPSILPVFEYIDWVQYSAYANGAFTLTWREDFDSGTLPSGWLTGNWASQKNLSTHDPRNVNFIDGAAVLSLTADNATGDAGADPGLPVGAGGSGTAGAAAGGAAAGGAAAGGAAGGTAAGGTTGSGATGGGVATGGTGAGMSGSGTGGNGMSGAQGGAPPATGGAGTMPGGAGSNSVSGTGGSAVTGANGGATAGGGTSNSGNTGTPGSGGAQGTGDATSAGGSTAAPTTSTSHDSGGCNIGLGRDRNLWPALLAVVVPLLVRRRRKLVRSA